MTYREICDLLQAAGIESAEWDTALLLEHFCGINPSTVNADPTRDFDDSRLHDAVHRRAERYPLQYLLGEWAFYRQTYEVSPDCLIPRADTERLVEEAILSLPRNARFADLCTGSGCIAVSVLAERPDTSALAVEKFDATLAQAVRNAQRNGVSERFTPMQADVLLPAFLPKDSQFDAILSNPPYIRTQDLATLEPELFAEPSAALDGGADGLVFYRRILENTYAHLRSGGFFLFEIGYDQAAALTDIAKAYGFSEIRVLRDYGGQDRVVYLKKA